MKSLITLFTFLIFANPAFAAWASGGGQIHRDGQNPWFLENTVVVRYCIDLDEPSFGISAAVASRGVRAALKDWVSAFANAKDDYYGANELAPYGQLRLGTQTFQEHACADPVELDLRFQLGRLRPEQEKLFDSPKDFVGIAVRSDYNKVTLRAKGFIYLSPTAGPLTPNHPRLHPAAWAAHDGFPLKLVLRHELGHVFGVDHQPDSVMDDKLPELVVDKVFLDQLTGPVHSYIDRRFNVMRLFGLKKDWLVEECGQRNPVSDPYLFHRQYAEGSCGRVTLRGDQLTVEFKDGPHAQFETVGSATFSGAHTNSEPAISVYLPCEQQVFSQLPEEARGLGRLFGESRNTNRKWIGILRIESTGERFPLQIESNASESSATVLKNDRFESDKFFLE